ncbi:MAG: DHH family phosphoesterase, partial [Armatimonadota bacterium]|nr:DHH family phosphoesterase [Armatimonadota bacterium]
MSRDALPDAAAALAPARRVLCASHVNPDGDTMGSALALALALRGAGKEVSVVCADPVPPPYRFMPGSDTYLQEAPEADFDVAVVLDCDGEHRLGSAAPAVRRAACVVEMDHHTGTDRFGHIVVVDASAAAVGEMVFSLLRLLGYPLTGEIATNLYVAILTDTGSFRFANTTPRSFRIAAELMECGADPARIAENVYETRSAPAMAVLGRAYTCRKGRRTQGRALLLVSGKERETMKPISLQLYSVRAEAAKDFAATLKKVADIGYKGVEFAGLHGLAPAEVKKMVDDLGLEVSSAHMPLPTPENRNQLVDECKTLGIPKLISGFGGNQLKSVEDCLAAAAKVRQAVSLLEGTGIAFGLHNHWWEFEKVQDIFPMDILLVNAPQAFSETDVYWAEVGCGDAVTAVAARKARIPLLHVKDGMIEPKQPMTAVGSGKLNIPAIIKAADPDV